MRANDKPLFAASVARPEVFRAVMDHLSEDDDVIGVEIHQTGGLQIRAIDKSQVHCCPVCLQ